ncbi:MFS transporter, CP family, cyanate transporter [Faunimonas pinastri]|uniref:MFS transporter, CP family, cyanate transporter n=1 Tax=Faunimonas pinastri TaxID=1855383 RepID=A0A1H9PGW1_9HYPH|nr:MFS transporter [Faunimonas pinastri]SER47330.1 MFS transporter, CP family, cyanate transporter [Faunimonas pinastri]
MPNVPPSVVPSARTGQPPVAGQLVAGQLVDAEADAQPTPVPTPAATPLGRLVLGGSLVLIAFNLRPVFSSLSALLPEVMLSAGLSTATASILTTLPVLCLGMFAPLAPGLARRVGAERVLLGALLLIAIGSGLRGFGTVPALFAGTFFAGFAIALGNVLLPGLVKRDFASRAALMTGLYTMALCAGAACAAGFTVPIQRLIGGSWAGALAVWAIPAVIVLLLWVPQSLRTQGGHQTVSHRIEGLWRDPLAWQITLFMGLQSALAYIVFGWLAPILRERGMDAASAGFVVSVSVMVQVVTCLLVPHLAMRGRDQRLICVVLPTVALIGLLGFLFAPLWTVWFWAVVQGIGQGGLIAIAMMLIVLRSPDARVASHLSGMVQGVGYLIAATGPLLVGLLHGWMGSFTSSAIFFVLLWAGAAFCGWGAGRATHVNVSVREHRARTEEQGR